MAAFVNGLSQYACADFWALAFLIETYNLPNPFYCYTAERNSHFLYKIGKLKKFLKLCIFSKTSISDIIFKDFISQPKLEQRNALLQAGLLSAIR